MSFAIRVMFSPPRMKIRIAMTAIIRGRFNARRTIHMVYPNPSLLVHSCLTVQPDYKNPVAYACGQPSCGRVQTKQFVR